MMRMGMLASVLTLAAGCSGSAETASWSEEDAQVARTRMVRQQLKAPGRDIRDQRVLEAMRTVPRHEFVPGNVRAQAYQDTPLPIGHGQTISQPFIVAYMTELLDPDPGERVLEVGTGSGYQAAILSRLVGEVYTIEIVEPLGERAREALAAAGCANVHVRLGDGYRGWPEAAPFDSIIVTCAPDHVPQPLVDQLKEGGRLVIPVGDDRDVQKLVVLRKTGGKVQRESVLPVRFVPMTGEAEER